MRALPEFLSHSAVPTVELASGKWLTRTLRTAWAAALLALSFTACSIGPSDDPIDVGVTLDQDGSLRLLLVDCLGRQLLALSVGFSEEPMPFITEESPLWQLERDPGVPPLSAGPEVLTITVGQPPAGLQETPVSDWMVPPFGEPRYLVIDFQVGDLGTGHVLDTADLRPGSVALPLDRDPVSVERFIEMQSSTCEFFAGLRH